MEPKNVFEAFEKNIFKRLKTLQKAMMK